MLDKLFKSNIYRRIAACLIILPTVLVEHCNARPNWPGSQISYYDQSIYLKIFAASADIKIDGFHLASIADASKSKLNGVPREWNLVPWQDEFRSLLAAPDEPFEAAVEQIVKGNIESKWQAVKNKIAAEAEILAACRRKPEGCLSIGARKFLAINKAAKRRNGLAQVGEVNRAVNLAVHPESDLAQYGVVDYWASPLETLTNGEGDCEDYAIAKYAILLSLGLSEKNLRLVIVKDARLKQDHAVVSVRINGHWRVLDNRTFVMLSDEDANTYRPLFVLGSESYQVVDSGFGSVAEYPRSGWPSLPTSTIGSISSSFISRPQ